jgi:multidrug efflux pump subunit AcrB
VLISFIKQLREDGYSMEEALLHGCGHRFRPVMMTASVAMLALVPMLISGGPGSEVTRPLAAVVIAGLIHQQHELYWCCQSCIGGLRRRRWKHDESEGGDPPQ